MKTILKSLRSFVQIFNLKTLIVTFLSMLLTYLCMHFNITANIPQFVIGIAVVFPIVFSISSAFQRRENALKDYSCLKANSRSIYLSARDWFEDKNPEQLEKARNVIQKLLISIRICLAVKKKVRQAKECDVYEHFSELSMFIKDLRLRGMVAGELSRVNQYLCKMVEAFENMKHVSEYRTPVTLRAYSRIFIVVTPLIYSPYFAFEGMKMNDIYLALITPFLTSIVLVGLDNIQDDLEKPFDQIGEDDIFIHAENLTKSFD